MKPIISVQSLTKTYLIGHQASRGRYSSLRETLSSQARQIVKRCKDLITGSPILGSDVVEDFQALSDVSFDIQAGEVVGVIGRNGAGKSTLLKVLSRITEPTRGRVVLRGKVASLLEVGTGFHPELTGRENIFLNGAILGMSRQEIKHKFDQIVDFAEIERFLDTPVKRYSSGMYVRLAFSVAAHLDPEILVVDEVLAVGDAQFQNKCLGRMHDVASEGRTVLFVSHNMGVLRRLCTRGIVLRKGVCIYDGDVATAISHALDDSSNQSSEWVGPEKIDKMVGFTRIWASSGDAPNYSFSPELPWQIHFEYAITQACAVQIAFRLNADDGTTVFTSAEGDVKSLLYEKREPGRYRSAVTIPGDLLAPGRYSILAAANQPGAESYDLLEKPIEFEISMAGSLKQNDNRWGVICPRLPWQTTIVSHEF